MRIKRKRQGLIFIISTFISSYLLWGTLCLSALGKIDKNIFHSMYNELYVLGGFMPSIVGIIFTIYFDGKKGIESLLEKLTLRNTKFRYLLFVCLFTLATILIPKLICNIFGIPSDISIRERFTGVNSIISNILYFIAVFFIGGGVNEEFGWRGFLLPRLQENLHPFIASIVIGVIWSLWHIPLFIIMPQSYVIGNLSIGLSFFIYGIETIWLSCVFTWLFNKTKGCLLLLILFHAIDNTVLSMVNIDNSVISPYLIILNAFRIIIFIFIIIDMFKHSSEKVTKPYKHK